MNPAAELGLVQAILSDPATAMPGVVRLLDKEDFSATEYADVYQAAKELYVSGSPVDEITIAAHMGKGTTVSDLTAYTLDGRFVPASRAASYGKIIRDAKIARVCAAQSRIISEMNGDASTEERLVAIEKLSGYIRMKQGSEEPSDTESVIAEVKEEIENYLKHPPLLTGFAGLDNAIQLGLQPGHLWVWCGYTSAGKTAAACNLVSNLYMGKGSAPPKGKTLFFSLEMTRSEIMKKFLACVADIGTNQIVRSLADTGPEAETRRYYLEAAFKIVQEWPVEIFERVFHLDHMLALVEQHQRVAPVTLMVLDYAQLIRKDGSSDLFETMRESAFVLKEAAKRLGITIFVTGQVNNESVKDPHNTLIPFKGGGDIPASSEVCVLMKTDGHRIANIDIRKNKHGVNASFNVAYSETWSRLTSLPK